MICFQDTTVHLESNYNHHRLYKQNHHLFMDWLREIKQRLQVIHDDKGTKDTVHSKLRELDVS